MPRRSARLLCVGTDLEPRKTRCAVLSQSGYDAQSATISDAEILLRREEFDLISLNSATNRVDIAATAPGLGGGSTLAWPNSG